MPQLLLSRGAIAIGIVLDGAGRVRMLLTSPARRKMLGYRRRACENAKRGTKEISDA
jgi:hypothetical protein